MRKGLLRLVVLAPLVSGCYLDHVVRDIERHSEALQQENNEMRGELARLRQQMDREARATVPSTDAVSELKKTLEGMGIEVTAEGGKLKLKMLSSVLFQPGSATVRPEAKRALKEVAAQLNGRFPDALIRVEGHTDSDPIKKTKDKYASNWELSAARALGVLHALRAEGVDYKRMYAAAYADVQPIASNASESGKSQNRRVEIVILPPLPVTKTAAN